MPLKANDGRNPTGLLTSEATIEGYGSILGAGGLGVTLQDSGPLTSVGTTGSGTYTSTILLKAPDYYTKNPFTVLSTGLVSVTSGDGIRGTSGYTWTIFNQGTVKSSSGNGIYL